MDWIVDTEKERVGGYTINTKFSPTKGNIIEMPNGDKYRVLEVGWKLEKRTKGIYDTIGCLIVEKE
jgi:hypothetical protein